MTQALGLASLSPLASRADTPRGPGVIQRLPGTRLRIGLNAYSFNTVLMAGRMKLEDVIDYCALHHIAVSMPPAIISPAIRRCPATSTFTV